MVKEFFIFIRFMFIYLLLSPIIGLFILWFTIPVAIIIMFLFDLDFKKSLEIVTIVAVVYNGVDSYRSSDNKGENEKQGFKF
jgi:hypothetical protein